MVSELVEEWETTKAKAKFAKSQTRPRRPANRRAAPAAILPGIVMVYQVLSWFCCVLL